MMNGMFLTAVRPATQGNISLSPPKSTLLLNVICSLLNSLKKYPLSSSRDGRTGTMENSPAISL